MVTNDSGRVRVAGWVWRLTVAVYLTATLIRGWKVVPEATTAFQFAQFVPVAVGLVLMVALARPRVPGRPATILLVGLAGYLAVAIASAIVSVNPSGTLAQAAVSWLMFGFVGWNALVRWREDVSAVRGDLAWVVAFMAVAQLLGLIVLAIEPEYATAWTGGRYLGLFENANYAGVSSGISIVIVVYLFLDAAPRTRGLLLAAVPPLIAALVLSGSRTALTGCVAGVAVVLVVAMRRPGAKAAIAVAAAAIAALIVLFPVGELRGEETLPSQIVSEPPTPVASASPSSSPDIDDDAGSDGPDVGEIVNDQTSGRLDLYVRGLEAWLESPILGHGFKTTPLVLDGLEAHNLVIGVLIETGALGLLFFVVVIVAFALLFRSRNADLRFAGPVAAVGVAEMTSSAFFGWGAPVTVLLWLVIVGAFFVRHAPVAVGRTHPADE